MITKSELRSATSGTISGITYELQELRDSGASPDQLLEYLEDLINHLESVQRDIEEEDEK